MGGTKCFVKNIVKESLLVIKISCMAFLIENNSPVVWRYMTLKSYQVMK
ncbi:hypothetical protein WP3S18E02_17770 [Aeromonas caviae]|nr:hypothetical protein WP3S18E02_17770 [Aeromonas caviae]